MLKRKKQHIVQHVLYLLPSWQIPELSTVKTVFFLEPVHSCLFPLSDIPEDLSCKYGRSTRLDH